MRIADSYLQEIIDTGGGTRQGPVSREATCRIALDLREARELLLKQSELLAELGVELMRREGLLGKGLSPGKDRQIPGVGTS